LSSKLHLQLPSGLCPSSSSGKLQHAFLISSIHAACLAVSSIWSR
jgi:hypothetical protein